MYSIQLGLRRLKFESALISIPRDLSDSGDWMNSDFVDDIQKIEVIQRTGSAVVVGLSGFGAEKGKHVVETVFPPLQSKDKVISHIVSTGVKEQVQPDAVRAAVDIAEYPCGLVIALNWGKLGFAPGGRQYWILPFIGDAISLGFLRLNWPTVSICSEI